MVGHFFMGGWGWVKAYFGCMGVDGHFSWVGEGGWTFFMGRWGWVEVYCGWEGSDGGR